MTGSGGDTVRSRRLRERLQARERFTPEDVLEIHFDAVNSARRDIVRIALHMRNVLGVGFVEEAQQALGYLEQWQRSGASSALDSKGAELAVEINTLFRPTSTGLALIYGGGESGLCYFLKTAVDRIERGAKAGFSQLEQQYIEQSLAGAWRSALQKYGSDPAAWNQRAREEIGRRKLGYFEGFDGFPSLDSRHDLPMPVGFGWRHDSMPACPVVYAMGAYA
jgi:hypothetical protein